MSDPENTWPDGTKRSTNNGFTHGMLGKPHGFVAGTSTRAAKALPKNSRPDRAFGVKGGGVPGLKGRD